MDDAKGTTTMTWEELEDCGVSNVDWLVSIPHHLLSLRVSMNTLPATNTINYGCTG